MTTSEAEPFYSGLTSGKSLAFRSDTFNADCAVCGTKVQIKLQLPEDCDYSDFVPQVYCPAHTGAAAYNRQMAGLRSTSRKKQSRVAPLTPVSTDLVGDVEVNRRFDEEIQGLHQQLSHEKRRVNAFQENLREMIRENGDLKSKIAKMEHRIKERQLPEMETSQMEAITNPNLPSNQSPAKPLPKISNLSDKQIENMKRDDLREICRKSGLKSSGKKSDLVTRVKEHRDTLVEVVE